MTTQADIAVVEQAAAPAARSRLGARLVPLDALRGLIIVAMALDHANAFIAHAHPPPEMWSAPTVAPLDTLAFLTRFVTHFAAPGFFFLMGAGMVLLAESRRGLGWSEWAIVRHLVLRGQGHNVIGAGCMPKLFTQFVEKADAKALDAECLDHLAYVPPFTSFNGWEP